MTTANPVKIGFFSFTEVTDPGEHRAYNEWHMLDHMPEQYAVRGVAWGQRWVATPRCRAARVASEPALDPVHYVTCYLMTDPVEQTLDEFRDLGATLHAAGRFHRHRRALRSGPLRLVRTAVAPRVRVSAAVVPYRPNRGIWLEVVDGGRGPDLDEHLAWRDTTLTPARLAVPGVAGIWEFATTPALRERQHGADAYRVSVCYLDDDPVATAARLADVDAEVGAGTPPPARADVRTVLAGPLASIEPWRWDLFDDA